MNTTVYAAGSATRLITLAGALVFPLLGAGAYLSAPRPEEQGAGMMAALLVLAGIVCLALHVWAHGFELVVDEEGVRWRGFRRWSVRWDELERVALRQYSDLRKEYTLERLHEVSEEQLVLELYRAGVKHTLAGSDIENFVGAAQRIMTRVDPEQERVVPQAEMDDPGAERHRFGRLVLLFPLVLVAFGLAAVVATAGKELVGGPAASCSPKS